MSPLNLFPHHSAQHFTQQDFLNVPLENSENSIIEYIDKIILFAIKQGASDIHFEPYEKYYRIRMRLDGLLHEIATPSPTLIPPITARIKIMAQLDISEHRLPQDGRYQFSFEDKTFDFRISTCPTLHGEKIVVRILNPTNIVLTIDHLGFEPAQKDLFLNHLKKPQGMILVTGPTGSGKTVTLYTALSILNSTQVNILTIEDPVEIYLPGVNQVNINLKAGLHFTNALRAFLRQDPDIIMIGEIRDRETAEIAIKAAQTGHLVLATLHTNNAVASLTRLLNMGIPAHYLTASISLVLAQRLVRCLCKHCKAQGCERCHSGYKGRCGVFELLPITDTLNKGILNNAPIEDIFNQARTEGMQTLYEIGLEKIKQGITNLFELHRVLIH